MVTVKLFKVCSKVELSMLSLVPRVAVCSDVSAQMCVRQGMFYLVLLSCKALSTYSYVRTVLLENIQGSAHLQGQNAELWFLLFLKFILSSYKRQSYHHYGKNSWPWLLDTWLHGYVACTLACELVHSCFSKCSQSVCIAFCWGLLILSRCSLTKAIAEIP